MSTVLPFSRRLLLGRMAGGSGLLFGTFLLPLHVRRAMARSLADKTDADGRLVAWNGRKPPPAHRPPPPLIMLDPGHGGKDPGAIGVSGTYEKHIALDAAFELKRLLEATGRYRVRMTRWTDVFVPLETRVARAQEAGAALFMSMHADAIHDRAVRGASVYTLSNSASDPVAAALARRENSADRFMGPGWRNASPEVASILSSLMMRETKIDSVRLAKDMVRNLDREVDMLPNPDRHAGFVVLKSAQIPSVLVEMGFMSNRQDESLLRRPQHRAVVAGAMRQAVEAYFAAAHRVAGVVDLPGIDPEAPWPQGTEKSPPLGQA
ncbi:MAG: N-acetylmuramoyl-L-alanine amidase [Rhodospirillales bacterium]|nr:N-acetylmuramoyl-L-alanine amidase [Rhodospirillales bacterium]